MSIQRHETERTPLSAYGFAGYVGCPAAPCDGAIAWHCTASGDCAALALVAKFEAENAADDVRPSSPEEEG